MARAYVCAHVRARSHLRMRVCVRDFRRPRRTRAKTFNAHAIFSVECFFVCCVLLCALVRVRVREKITGYLCVCAIGAQGHTHARTNFVASEIKLVVQFFVCAGTTKTSVPTNSV